MRSHSFSPEKKLVKLIVCCQNIYLLLRFVVKQMGSMLINYKTTSCEHRGIHIAVIKFPLPKANKYTITFI